MTVSWNCPACERTSHTRWSPEDASLDCQHCGHRIATPQETDSDGKLTSCVVCGCNELFVRKDFPQRLGVLIVIIGFAISTVFWAYRMPIAAFAAMFAVAAIDFALYFFVPNALMCYRCHAQYRGSADMGDFGAFELETHERYRQQAARLEQAGASKPAGNRDA
ncbi:MAG: hypothetical protein MI757_18660 [Pirellulales bacterium]|nr:hypothetical protein [Pirellulales bacterium]